MSSILKALKKAEQEGSTGHSELPASKRAMHRLFKAREKKTASRTTFWHWLILTAAGMAIILLIFFRIPLDRQIKKAPALSSNGPLPVTQNIPLKISEPHRNETAVVKNLKRPEPVMMPGTGIMNPVRPKQLPVPPLPETQARTVSEGLGPSEPFPDHASMLKPKHAASPEPFMENRKTEVPPAAPNNDDQPDMPPLEDTGLKIQAISWDQDPEARVAVINNMILSENDRISGYRIIRIDKEQVVAEKSGRQVIVSFRYR